MMLAVGSALLGSGALDYLREVILGMFSHPLAPALVPSVSILSLPAPPRHFFGADL